MKYDDMNGRTSDILGIFALAGLLMIALKVLEVIDWSWWIILAPFYIPAFLLIVSFIVYLIDEWRTLR